jgi:uncharacterized protein YnzC (UPF0291/DUF896 family)
MKDRYIRMDLLLKKSKRKKLSKEEDEELDKLSISFMDNERIKSILHRTPISHDPLDKEYIEYELSMYRRDNKELSPH